MDDELRAAERAYNESRASSDNPEAEARRYIAANLRAGTVTIELLLRRIIYLEEAVLRLSRERRTMLVAPAGNSHDHRIEPIRLPSRDPLAGVVADWLYQLTHPETGVGTTLPRTTIAGAQTPNELARAAAPVIPPETLCQCGHQRGSHGTNALHRCGLYPERCLCQAFEFPRVWPENAPPSPEAAFLSSQPCAVCQHTREDHWQPAGTPQGTDRRVCRICSCVAFVSRQCRCGHDDSTHSLAIPQQSQQSDGNLIPIVWGCTAPSCSCHGFQLPESYQEDEQPRPASLTRIVNCSACGQRCYVTAQIQAEGGSIEQAICPNCSRQSQQATPTPNGCPDCGGTGIGDYPFECHTCGGRGTR